MNYINELKGELKKNISKIKDRITKTDLERQLKEATSNEHCHANVSLLNEISFKTSNYADLQVIVSHISKKLNCRKEKWRKILKCLFLVEHVLKTGSLNFYDSMRSLSYQFKNLNTFSYIDENRADKGETIREKSRMIIKLLEDKDRLMEERKKYSQWKSRIEGVGSGGQIGSVSSSSWNTGSRMYGSTSSDNYNGGAWNDYDSKKKEESSSSEEEEEEEEEEEKKKKKKHSHKKKSKKEESDEEEEEEEEEEKPKKKQEKKEKKKDKKDIQIKPTTGISIKKPGQKTQPVTSSSSNNAQSTGFDFDFGTTTTTTTTNPVQQPKPQTTTLNADFDSIFGGSSQPVTAPTTAPQSNAGFDFFDMTKQNVQPQQPQPSMNNQNMWSFPNTMPTNPPTNQNNFFNMQPNNTQPPMTSTKQANPQDLLSQLQNLNMNSNQPQTQPSFMNQPQTMNTFNPMGYNMYQNNQSSWNYQQPKPQQQAPVFDFGASSKPVTVSNNNNDDDFKEVEEDEQKPTAPKTGLNVLLDSKLVDLDNLKGNKNQGNNSNNAFNNYNFY